MDVDPKAQARALVTRRARVLLSLRERCVHVVDAARPGHTCELGAFVPLPHGHTTTCVDECRYLWTASPACQRPALSDKRSTSPTCATRRCRSSRRCRSRPRTAPASPRRRHRPTPTTCRSTRPGIAWVSGESAACAATGRRARHYDPLTGDRREATATDPVPYAGGAFADDGTPSGSCTTPRGRSGSTLATARPEHGEARLADHGHRGGGRAAGLRRPRRSSRSPRCEGQLRRRGLALDAGRTRSGCKHRRHVEPARAGGHARQRHDLLLGALLRRAQDGSVAYSWYDQGTRILDVSDPTKPIQVAYYRPDGGVSWAPYFHRGYVYVADHGRGVEVLKVSGSARTRPPAARKELVAPRAPSATSGWCGPPRRGLQARPAARLALPADEVLGRSRLRELDGRQAVEPPGVGRSLGRDQPTGWSVRSTREADAS